MQEIYRKRLTRALELSQDEAFIQMVWATNMIQSGHPEAGLKYLRNVHPDAVTDQIPSQRFLYKWELETIVNELLRTKKRRTPIRDAFRALDCSDFNSMVHVVNTLRRLENCQDGPRLRRFGVLEEMSRISARQFEWQRGWFNTSQFYRSTYIYGTGAAADFFQATHGLSINEFSLVGVALYSHFCAEPTLNSRASAGPLPISQEAFRSALRLLACPIAAARDQCSNIRRGYAPVAYQPSVLRTFPCISFGESAHRIRCPLPQLILERVTSGILYDVAPGGWQVREEYGQRFEQYCLRYLSEMLPSIRWAGEKVYRWRKAEAKSPDILWQTENGIRLAIECKATRMSIDARYADDPLVVRGYNDIIKAVYQLWRYFSHCRRGLTGDNLHDEAHGMVLTIDSWLLMARNLIPRVMERATEMATKNDPDITKEDRKPILFCAISDLENVLATANEATFDAALNRAVTERRQGWLLSSSHDEVCADGVERRDYPFMSDLAEVLPWWKWVDEKEGVRS